MVTIICSYIHFNEPENSLLKPYRNESNEGDDSFF